MRNVVNMDLESIIKAIDALPMAKRGNRLDPTEDQKKLLLTYWDSGRSHSEIARVLGVATSTALRWYREAKNDNR